MFWVDMISDKLRLNVCEGFNGLKQKAKTKKNVDLAESQKINYSLSCEISKEKKKKTVRGTN